MNYNIWHQFCLEVRDNDKSGIIRFESRPGADIYDTANEIISILRLKKDDNDYTFTFNDKDMQVNKYSTVREIMAQYYDATIYL